MCLYSDNRNLIQNIVGTIMKLLKETKAFAFLFLLSSTCLETEVMAGP